MPKVTVNPSSFKSKLVDCGAMDQELAKLRRDYAREELSENSVEQDPFRQFSIWLAEAMKSAIVDANAMTLSTVDAENKPSARVVLLKGFSEQGLIFYTNYESKKAADLAVNPNAVLHFFWAELERQVMIAGAVKKIGREESENYFKKRPLESRLSAWASKQSSVIDSRKILEERVDEFKEQFGDDVPLPPFWGGYILVPESFEFWQGRPSRLHDRIVYQLDGKKWKLMRLSP